MKNKFLNLILIISFVFSGFTVYAEDIVPIIDPVPDPVLVDTTSPVITLNGDLNVNLYAGQEYVEAGATAIDDVDGDITISVIVGGVVDASIPGVYVVNYDVSDSSLNAATTVSRTVTIREIPKVDIHLEIETSTGSIYNSDLEVSACIADSTNTYKLTPYCALSSSGVGVGVGWSWWGEDAFLNEINGVVNNSNNNGVYWGWFANLELGQVALNKYTLKSGDSILLNYDINPIRILADNISPKVGDSVNFTVQSFGYDGSWNPVWSNASEAVVKIGTSTLVTDINGNATYNVDSSGEIKASAHKDGFIDSNNIILNVPVVENSSGGGSSNAVFSISNANNFLVSIQGSDGSFGDILYTDWVAISAGISNAPFVLKLKNYLQNYIYSSDITTDNERHAMALSALGINPYNGTSINYIEKIVRSFDGVQIGDANLINDDIFGLIILGKSGYTQDDDVISKDITYVINNQLPNGSWGDSVDMTAAGVQVLRFYGGNTESVERAENYLVSSQSQSDGGFGNNFSTSWAIQALMGNGSLSSHVARAENYLASRQQSDGGMEDVNSDISNRIWSTSYAVPAMMHNSFFDSLNSFSKYIEPVVTSIGGGNTSNIKKDEIVAVKDILVEKIPEIKNEEIIPLRNNEIIRNPKINQIVNNKVKTIQDKEIVKSPGEVENINLSASAANSGVSDKIYLFMSRIFTGISHVFRSFLSIFN